MSIDKRLEVNIAKLEDIYSQREKYEEVFPYFVSEIKECIDNAKKTLNDYKTDMNKDLHTLIECVTLCENMVEDKGHQLEIMGLYYKEEKVEEGI